MAEILNLNRARKAKRRDEREKDAAANRLRFGRAKATRERDAAETLRRDALLDGARREE